MNKRHPAFSVILILSMFVNVLISPFASAVPVLAAGIPLIDDFEAGLPIGKDGNNLGIGFNTFQDPNSTVAITTTATPPAPVPGAVSPNNVLQMNVNVISFAGFAHTFENAAVNQWVTQDWSAYAGISFWLYGNNSGTTMFVDVLDNRNSGSIKDDAERWSVDVKDDFSGWKQIQLPFDSMHRKEIGNGAPNDGFGLTEVNGWAFGTITTPSPQIYYLDNVSVYGVAPFRPLTVGFSAINYKVTEGATATVTAKLSKPSSDPVTVSYATTIGGAIANRDYTPAAGTLTFAPNVTQQSFSVPTFNNMKYQGERGVQVELSNPTGGAALGIPPVARVTILDNEAFDPTLLDDFETAPYLWSAEDEVRLSNPEIAAGTVLALPGQGAYEHILQALKHGKDSLEFGRQFPIGQDWSNADGLNFWYYGQNSGKNIKVKLTNSQTSAPANWQLAWNDEFNSKRGTAPDARNWGHEVGDGVAIGNPGWGNDELQYYTDSTANAATDGKGNLVISAKQADGSQQCYYGPCKFTSARLLTKNKFEVAYGRIEARIKVPRGAGLWPAFWMLGTDIDQVNWPQTGEIDIMENVGRLPNQVFGTLHGPGYSGGQSYGGIYNLSNPVADKYHIFSVEWQPDKVVWFIDGIQYFSATPNDAFLQGKQWVFNHPFFLLMNVAVGGNFGGAVGADTTFPQAMKVDYVRLYQAKQRTTEFRASFSDNFTGWQKVTIPFTAFQGKQGTALDLTNVTGIRFKVPDGMRGAVLLDQVRLVGTPSTKTQMDLPVTFDSPTVAYGLLGFGGADNSTIVIDPTGGANQVAKVIKSATAELWAGTTLTGNGTLGFANKVPFSASATKMTVRVYSPDAGIQVRLKAEDHTNPGISVETEATTTVANAWETLTFDFANQVAGTASLNLANTYDKASIFFNFGVTGATAGAKTYYFDDVLFVPASGGSAWSPITFDSSAVTYTLTGFGGAEDSTVVIDPVGGTNKVAKVVKSATAELWAGTTVSTGANFSVPTLPFTAASTKMTVRVYSPDAGIQVRLKVEDAADPTKSVETEATTTVANAWETLTFDFANQAAGTAALNLAFTYNKVSIFFNFGVTGATAGAKTYYFDDVAFLGGTPPPPTTWSPITFDENTITYTLTGFGGAEDSTVVIDPVGGTNKVAKVVKSATAELWAGTTVSTGPNFSVPTLPFTAASTKMTVRVYSPDAGIQVRLKVENAADPTKSVETEATTTVANAWETLTFDFANQAAGTAALNLTFTYNKASIFFNFGVTGATAGAKTYYFDDVAFLGSTTPPPTTWSPITFDSSAVTYTLTGFGGAEDSTVVIDPVGGTNKVAKVVKSATAELWAGTTVSTDANLSVPTLPFTASNTKMTVRVYSPDAGIQVRLKVETVGDPTRSVETEATTTVANTWETLTFDFANQAAGTAALNLAYTYNRASIFFNFGVTGATAGAKTYYLDDVTFGGTPTPPTTWSPITFDASTLTYTLTGFGGAEDSTVVVDPTNSANNVAKVVKSATAELWAGTTVSTGPNFSVPTLPFTAASTKMTVRIYSPNAGIQVRLKVEDAADPTRSVETEAATTVANAWETLTFDFANQAAGTAALNLAFTFNKTSIFFNFGVTGATAGAKTYYLDDITFGP